MRIIIESSPKEIATLMNMAKERPISKISEEVLTLLAAGEITVSQARKRFGLEPIHTEYVPYSESSGKE